MRGFVSFIALAAMLTASAVMAEDMTPAQRELRAATEAANPDAIQTALEKVYAERHGIASQSAAKPADSLLADAPKTVPAKPKTEVSITAEPTALAPKAGSGWKPGKDTDLTYPRTAKNLGRFTYTVVNNAGYATKQGTLAAAKGIFYDKKEADATTEALYGSVKRLEAKVDAIEATSPPPPTPPSTKPSEPAPGSPEANKALGSGGLGSVAPTAPPPVAEPRGDQPPAIRHMPLEAWLALAAAILALVLLLILFGRRQGWSPSTWVRSRMDGARSWWNNRGGGGTPPLSASSSGPSTPAP